MLVKNIEDKISTQGYGDLKNITDRLVRILDGSGVKNGLLTVFITGSTAAITTFEFEPGLIKDLAELYDKLAPQNKRYHHDATWGDGNGFSHVRAALQGPSLSIPIKDGSLVLGTWQQVVIADFDNRPRTRKFIVNIIGE